MHDPMRPPIVRNEQGVLSHEEAAVLRHFEALLRQAALSYVVQGKYLAEIRDRRLYRQGYDSFEDYCARRWDVSRSYAHDLRAACEVAEQLAARGFSEDELPRNVTQGRELSRADGAEARAAVWREVLDECGERVTADAVRAAVRRRVIAAAEAAAESASPDDRELRLVAEHDVRGTEPADPARPAPPTSAIADVPRPPVRDRLPPERHAALDAQVALWAEVDSARRAFATVARRALAQYRGPDAGLTRELRRIATLDGPDGWRLCAGGMDGGCDGAGETPLGACLKCGGLGFRMRYQTRK